MRVKNRGGMRDDKTRRQDRDMLRFVGGIGDRTSIGGILI